MKKEDVSLIAKIDSDQTGDPCSENLSQKSKPLDNKYKSVSLFEFKKIINQADRSNSNEDLEIVVDLLVCLAESINICQKTNPRTELYIYHASRIKYFNTILKDFAWFEELKKNHSEIFSCDDLQIK